MTETYDDFNGAGSKISKDEIKRLLIERLPSVLKHILPKGVFRHSEFHVGDVQGNSGKSLVVELKGPKAGLWQDFATKESGDILTLWAKVRGMDIKRDFREVIASVQTWLGIPSETSTSLPSPTTLTSTSTPTAIDIISTESASTESTSREKLGSPTGKWDYLDFDGSVIASVYRYDTASGKQYHPYDARAGKYQKPAEPRPLYNLPGVKAAQVVVLVEGEKAAQALIDAGICATTAMFGANAPIEKTDWSPLFCKDVLIWPDNDEPGEKYSHLIAEKLKTMKIDSLSMVLIPENKPYKWDAADAVNEGLDITALLKRKILVTRKVFPIYKSRQGRLKTTPAAEDLIWPRILTPHGTLIFGGVPKVGKSDFMLHWLAHMAAGVPFLGMRPPRPLKILYLQAELEYDYICERIQQIHMDPELLLLTDENLSFTPDVEMVLDKEGLEMAYRSISRAFPDNDVDIIAVDPLRNFFDNQNNTTNENDNGAMLDFLRKRLNALRDSINPDAGIILIHHTRKGSTSDLKEAKFQAFAGASSLRGFYSTGILMWQPDEEKSECQLVFELRYGKKTPLKWIDKIDDTWVETRLELQQDAQTEHKQIHTAESKHKNCEIVKIIRDEACKGNVYTMNQFCESFDRKLGLGGMETIRKKLEMLATDGHIKFFHNAESYGLTNPGRTKYGYLCVEGMKLGTQNQTTTTGMQDVQPSHFKDGNSGNLLPIQNLTGWKRS